MAASDLVAARSLYEQAAEAVKFAGHEAYLPHQKSDPEQAPSLSPEAVFEADVRALLSSDGMIAFLDEPSLGVGAELAICVQNDIPTLGLAHHPSNVSRFALGCIFSGRGDFQAFSDVDQLTTVIGDFLRRLPSFPHRGSPCLSHGVALQHCHG